MYFLLNQFLFRGHSFIFGGVSVGNSIFLMPAAFALQRPGHIGGAMSLGQHVGARFRQMRGISTFTSQDFRSPFQETDSLGVRQLFFSLQDMRLNISQKGKVKRDGSLLMMIFSNVIFSIPEGKSRPKFKIDFGIFVDFSFQIFRYTGIPFSMILHCVFSFWYSNSASG